MNVEEIMNSGKLYRVGELTDAQGHSFEYLQIMEEYNAAGYTPKGLAKKKRLLHELFAEAGENACIQASNHAMWGGRHVHLGKNVYINYNATLIDDAHIYIGDDTMIAPNVTILAASHPLSTRSFCHWASFGSPHPCNTPSRSRSPRSGGYSQTHPHTANNPG